MQLKDLTTGIIFFLFFSLSQGSPSSVNFSFLLFSSYLIKILKVVDIFHKQQQQ